MISRIIDWLDRKVNPEAYDPHSIKNNRYNQWESPAEEPTMPGVFNQTSAANQSNTTYQQGLGQQAQIYTTGIGGLGIGTAGGNWQVAYPGILGGQATQIYAVPPKSGMVFTIGFADEAGNHHKLVIDQAHVSIFNQIQASAGAQPNTYVIPPASPKMLEGDFSFDEMEEAEKLIAELAGDKATKGHEASQDTEYASEGI